MTGMICLDCGNQHSSGRDKCNLCGSKRRIEQDEYFSTVQNLGSRAEKLAYIDENYDFDSPPRWHAFIPEEVEDKRPSWEDLRGEYI